MLPLRGVAQRAMWCETTQDVSGYTADAVQSPSSELAASTSTTSPEYDIYTHDSGYPSPDELLWGDQDQLGEPNMYYNEDSYRQHQVELNDWLGNSDMEKFPTTPLVSRLPEAGEYPQQIKSENSVYTNTTEKPANRCLSMFAAEEIKYENPVAFLTVPEKPAKASGGFSFLENPVAIVTAPEKSAKLSGRLSVFATEEPRIAETASDLKPTFDPSMPSVIVMDFGGEVEVTTEEESPISSDDRRFSFEPKEELEDSEQPEFSPESAHPMEEFRDKMNREFFLDESIHHKEYRGKMNHPEELFTPEDLSFDCSPFPMDASQSPLRPVPVGLKLDIVAAMAPISSAESNTSLPNTPDLMTLLNTPDLLRPPVGFDLVDFIVVEGDANNNAISLPSPMVEEKSFQSQVPVQAVNDLPRGGKPWRLADLKGRPEAVGQRKREWRKPQAEVKPRVEQPRPPTEEPLAGPSRPARKSAEKFMERLEQGLLNGEDEEEEAGKDSPKKRRRSDSTTSSSRSSVCGDQDKYRERRDRNNLSSKVSRQKRKDQMKLKLQELKDLEEKNARLERQCKELREACDQANFIWQRYLEGVKESRRQ